MSLGGRTPTLIKKSLRHYQRIFNKQADAFYLYGSAGDSGGNPTGKPKEKTPQAA